MPEDDFWRRMNPARLHALYTAHFRQESPSPEDSRGIRADGSRVGSLSEYLRGG